MPLGRTQAAGRFPYPYRCRLRIGYEYELEATTKTARGPIYLRVTVSPRPLFDVRGGWVLEFCVLCAKYSLGGRE